MRELVFVTGNLRKVMQANTCLEPYGTQVTAQELDLNEIQSEDPIKISKAKANSAYKLINKPLVICDHSWAFNALKGFPGGYMKDINHWFEPEDFLALMKDKQDKTVKLTEVVVYIDDSHLEVFSVDFPGILIDEARGRGAVPCERVVVYDGSTKTIAQHIDQGEHARDMTKSAWTKFGKWYASAKQKDVQ